MKIRLLIVLTTLAFLGFSVSAFAGKGCRPNCSEGDYMVALTSGPFQFAPAKASLNKKGTLVGAEAILINRPDDLIWEAEAWDAVMSTCGGPLGADTSFRVDADDWSVYRNSPTQMGINLETIYLPNTGAIKKEIQIILRYYQAGDVFLPPDTVSGGPTIFPLNEYVMWGKPKGGGKHSGWATCFQSSSDENPQLPPSGYLWEFELQISLP